MAMELLVILASQHAPTAQSWESALKDSHAPVQFSVRFDPSKQTGFVPVDVQGQKSGFYFLLESYQELTQLYPKLVSINLEQPIVYSLGYGGHRLECAAALYSAAILVARFGGVAFDPQGATFVSQQELTAAAKQCQAMPIPD
jgi:hypothetical protein